VIQRVITRSPTPGEDGDRWLLRVVRKGARKAKIPLTPATMAALEAYLADRARHAGIADWWQLSRGWHSAAASKA